VAFGGCVVKALVVSLERCGIRVRDRNEVFEDQPLNHGGQIFAGGEERGM
jgi:hypothetical protein